METIWLAVVGAPWWVYPLLTYLILIGIKASKRHVVSIQQLFILPVIFSILSLSSLIMDLKFSGVSMGAWVVAFLIGAPVGWALVRRLEIKIDRKQGLIEMQGSWIPLIVMLVIFLSKFYFGYQLAIIPSLSEEFTFQLEVVSLSGFCVGLLLGRLFCFLTRFRLEEHVYLEKS